jgi:hypothetical protein
MGKFAFLAAVGIAALAPSLAQAQTTYQPCCQDTVKMFQHGFEGWGQTGTWKPYVPPAPVQYSAPQPCCQDTLKMFWHGFDEWAQPYAAKR